MRLSELLTSCLIAIFAFSGVAIAETDRELESQIDDANNVYDDITDEELIDELLGLAQCGKQHLPLCITGSCSGGKLCLPKINLIDPRKNTCSCQPLPKIGGA